MGTVKSSTLFALVVAALFAVCVLRPTTSHGDEPTILERAAASAKEAEQQLAAAKQALTEQTTRAAMAAEVATAADASVASAKEAAAKAAALAQSTAGDAAATAKDYSEKTVAAAQAAEKFAGAAKAVAVKAAADQAAAEKLVAEKSAAAQAASQKVLAERAYAANLAVRRIEQERAEASKRLAQAAEAARVAGEKLKAAEAAATQTAADHAAAAKLLAEKNAAADAIKSQAAAEQDVDKKKAAEDAAAKLESERAAAEKLATDKAAVAKTATDGLAKAKAEAEQAAAVRAAAEQEVATKVGELPKVLDVAAVAEAEAMGGLKPITSDQWDYAKARHLLSRAGFGGSPDEIARLHAMGLHGAVDYLVNYRDQPPSDVLIDVRCLERPLGYENNLDQSERSQLDQQRTNRERAQQAQLRQWWLRRMAKTPRPLEEKLTLFWHDHFATGYEDKLYQSRILYQQNELFRGFSDRFDALLRGIVHDPAMIIYLDNHVNRKGNGNENFGREIFELFSFGRDQGYTESDLRELSRALTGYTYVPYTNQFRFDGTRHDEGPKTLLGKTGNWSADEAVDIILAHPSTANYIAKKLFESFVHRQPADETIARLAHVLRSNHYELAPMLRNLFLSEEFYSERSRAQQIKSPVELMIGTVRMLNTPDVDYGALDWAIQNMGMTLFQPPNVSGWEEGHYWISANRVLLRYNGVANLVERPQVDAVALVLGKAQTAEEVVNYLANACLAVDLTPEQRQALVEFVGPLPPGDQWTNQRDQLNATLRSLLVLIMSTPSYQVM